MKKHTQTAVTQNVLLIGNYLTKKIGEHIRRIHGNEAKITVLSPTSERFTSRDGLKKFIGGKDEMVYVLAGEISEKQLFIVREDGLPFVQVHQDDRGKVTSIWTNVIADKQFASVSSDEEIEALKACGGLLATS